MLGPEECWPWQGTVDKHGYGRVKVLGAMMRAHRIVCAVANGKSQAGEVARHTCDNPRCCNPAHLVWGTQGENVRDMHSRGRAGRSKITAEEADLIRGDTRSLREIAADYSLSRSTVSRIRRGIAWGGHA